MKILVVGHNVFSSTESMGKTLASYFGCFGVEDLAQFYIHSEVPTTGVCESYFRITDKEAVKSIFTRKSGRVFEKNDVDSSRATSRTDAGLTAQIYQFGRKRSPLIYLARNMVWRFSAWKSKALLKWLDDFAPDAVFFASGDYSFMYRIALDIAKEREIPLFVSCMDDYYLNNTNKGSLLGKLVHRSFMKQVRRTMRYAEALFVICDKMAAEYSKLFEKKCFVLHTSTSIKEPLTEKKNNRIAYLGNLGLNRHLQLIEIGRALKKLNIENGPKVLDVYSAETRDEVLEKMTPENGIVFHGAVNAHEVQRIIGESLAVIHTESFEEAIKERVRYSVSTKIADSLASGTCLIAYGPSDVASIEYLRENNAAFVISEDDDITERLREIITNADLRKFIEANAVMLAKKNHDERNNGDLIVKVIGGTSV